MSEFTNHREVRVANLMALFFGITKGENLVELVRKNKDVIEHAMPIDIIDVVDLLVMQNIPMEELKSGINKFVNLLSSSILKQVAFVPEKDSFLDALRMSSEQMEVRLRAIRPLLKEINKQNDSPTLRAKLVSSYQELSEFGKHYTILENVLFPVLEREWANFRCVKVMWSFHDDIRSNIKAAIDLLQLKGFDIKQLNRLSGDISFNMFAMRFRAERLLFPAIDETIRKVELNRMLKESVNLGFPYTQPKIGTDLLSESSGPDQLSFEDIDLKTGFMSAEQLRLVFNHLPVDITFVDENNKVKYYSTPKKRIFPRTNSIIGRDVKNCHPHESVHVVEEIVEAFRKGEKERASFWIRMRGEFILIQYFAIRSEAGEYKGVVEVSQEISEIRSLEGENRLLDWSRDDL